MKLLVCGSRDYSHRDFLHETLDNYLHHKPLILIHGACPTGADKFASEWCKAHPAVYEIAVPAKWRLHGNSAGPARNRVLAELQPDQALAFYEPGAVNKGTRDMVNILVSEPLCVPVDPFWGDWPLRL